MRAAPHRWAGGTGSCTVERHRSAGSVAVQQRCTQTTRYYMGQRAMVAMVAAGVVGDRRHGLRHGRHQLSVALTCSAGATNPQAGRQPADAERRPLPTAVQCRPHPGAAADRAPLPAACTPSRTSKCLPRAFQPHPRPPEGLTRAGRRCTAEGSRHAPAPPTRVGTLASRALDGFSCPGRNSRWFLFRCAAWDGW